MSYCELHSCSAFSFLRGASSPEQLAEVAAELELPALALLDRNGVYGSQRFAVACREQGVRAIHGAELTMEDGNVLPVLVATRTGYENLCSLLTEAHLRSAVKGECAVRYDEFTEFADGLIALLGAAPRSPGSGETCAQKVMTAFGRDNVYVELQRHFLRGEERINRQLIDLASKLRLPVIATNGVQYAKPYGRQVLDVSPASANTPTSIWPESFCLKMPSAI